jgi:hypothetical protein
MAGDKTRFSFEQLLARLKATNQSLDRNWAIQLGLIGLGFAGLYFPEKAKELADLVKVPFGTMVYLVPIILTYLLAVFGYQLSRFLYLRRIFDKVACSQLDPVFNPDGRFYVLLPVSVFETLHIFASPKYKRLDRVSFVFHLTVLAVSIGLNHAICIAYISCMWAVPVFARVLVMLFYFALMLALYVQFCTGNPELHVRILVVSFPVLAVIFIFIYALYPTAA